MGKTVGIDLGTTYSLIAYHDKREGRPKCIPGPYGTPLCPSVVSVDADGAIIVGEPARRRLLTQPERTIYSVKRLMGRGPADVQDELKIFPFRIDPASANVIRVRLGDRVAGSLSVPFVPLLTRVSERPPQREMANAAQQAANVRGAFRVVDRPPPGTGVLLDDRRISGWTLAMVGGQLRRAGAERVLPLALATLQ